MRDMTKEEYLNFIENSSNKELLNSIKENEKLEEEVKKFLEELKENNP